MTITTVQAKVAKTGAFNGASIDISGMTGDWTLVIEIMLQSGTNPISRFSFQDSVDAFTTPLAGPGVSVAGIIGGATGTGPATNVKRYTFQKRDFPDMRFGTASAVLRLALLALDGSGSPSVTYQSWIES